MQEANADVIAVQEAWNVADVRQVELLANALQMHGAYAADLSFGSGNSGNGVLSRWPILRTAGCRLGGTCDADGGFAVHAEVGGPRGPLQVFSVILDGGTDRAPARALELAALLDWMATVAGDGPLLVCGDLNAQPDSVEMGMLLRPVRLGSTTTGFADAWESAGGPGPGYTWSRRNPRTGTAGLADRRIDYVLSARAHFDVGGKPLHCRLVGVEPVRGVQPSDHYAVLAELAY
jgi:endonuclease/exonuclease/phosphatase family metal-dependent hydrolase